MKTKKLLATVLSLCMILTMLPITTMAASATVYNAEDLRSAIANAQSGHIITFGSDITVEGEWACCEVPTGVTIRGGSNTFKIGDVGHYESNAAFYGSGFTVEDLTIERTGTDENGDNALQMNGGKATNVKVEGTFGSGIVASGGVEVDRCEFGEGLTWGVNTDGEVNGVASITKTEFNSLRAVALYGTETFTNNEVYGDKGLSVATKEATITGNIFEGERALSISADGVEISGNTIEGAVEIYEDCSADLSGNYWGENGAPADLPDGVTVTTYYTDEVDGNLFELPSGSGTEADPVLLKSAADLKWFRNQVNGGKTFEDKFVKLNADIDLENEDWTPIGNEDYWFSGSFDGGENTIYNLTINDGLNYYDGGENYAGLFGHVKNGGYIKNLTIENVQITGCLYVGGVVGRMEKSGVIENCHLTGDIDIEGYWYVGGIAGRYEYGTDISGCSVKGTANSIAKIEADVDAATNKEEDGAYAGAIVGFTTEPLPAVNITNNEAEYVDIKGVTRVGGIAGMAHQGSTFKGNSLNEVNIYAVQPEGYNEEDADTIGQIAGACQGTATNPVTFEQCTATVTTVFLNGEVYIEASEYGGSITDATPVTNYVARIGTGIYFTSLDDAMSAAMEGQTIELISGDKPISPAGSVVGKTVTITGEAVFSAEQGSLEVGSDSEADGTGKLIFKDANIQSEGAVLNVNKTGTVEIIENTSVSMTINVNGTLKSAGDISGTIVKNKETAEIEISAGTYTQDVTEWCVDGYESVLTDENTYKVQHKNISLVTSENATAFDQEDKAYFAMKINGGEAAVTSMFINLYDTEGNLLTTVTPAEGSGVIDNGKIGETTVDIMISGNSELWEQTAWTPVSTQLPDYVELYINDILIATHDVVGGIDNALTQEEWSALMAKWYPAAKIGETCYATLADAVEINDVTDITLLDDIDETLAIGKPLTIHLNEHTIADTVTAAEGYSVAKGLNKWIFGQADEIFFVTGVTLNATSTSVKVGSTTTLTATLAPENATIKNVTWASSDTNIATVADGVVTGVAEGTATITVTTEDGEFTAECTVTVNKRSSGGGGSSSTATTTTTKNDDGSTTKTTTNKTTGTVTETTTNPDGSTTKVETKKDGTVTTTEKDADGNTTTTVEKADGTSVATEKTTDGTTTVTEKAADGTTTITETDKTGNKTVTTENTDGSTVTEETKKDGTKVVTETNSDGEISATVEAKKETEVTIPVENADEVTKIVVTDENGVETEAEFTVTDGGVAITVDGNVSVSVQTGHICYTTEFADVDTTAWYHENVDYVIENGLMKGTATDKFEPNANLTRAMLVTILYRAEGEPEMKDAQWFEDVAKGQWYSDAVAWATFNGITTGYGDGNFGPDDYITREQIATIMFRYATYKGIAPTGAWAIRLTYSDLAEIADYATEGVMYCTKDGLMQGKGNDMFCPKDNATRAEIAAILHRFIEANK